MAGAPQLDAAARAGSVGIVKRLGAVHPEPLLEGIHLKVPFVDNIIVINIRLNKTNARLIAEVCGRSVVNSHARSVDRLS